MKLYLTLSFLIISFTTSQSSVLSQSQLQLTNRDVTTGDVLTDTIISSNVLQQILNIGNLSNLNTIASGASLLEPLNNLYALLENLQNSLPENECSRQLQLFFNRLVKMDDWAIRMFDASGKLQPGILEGNTMLVGNYDECLEIEVLVNGSQITGQYCTAVITGSEENTIDIYNKNSVQDFKVSFGFCMPAACDKTTLTEFARTVEATLHSTLHLQFFDELCDSTAKPKTLSKADIFCIVFFSAFGVIIVSSSIYDIFIYSKKKGTGPSLSVAFSFYTNGKKLFSIKSSGESLNCLNGIRVVSMLWIIAGHRYLYTIPLPLVNVISVLQWEKKSIGTLITASSLAVDSFFLISGLLLVYVFLNHMDKGQKFSVIMFYVHRILRLTPALVVLILFYATLLAHIGHGPLWAVVPLYFQHPCQTNWWSTLLYVQNYVHPTDLCVGHSWYLAVDTQLYFLSPLLLIPLIRWPKRTIFAIAILAITSSVIVFMITWTRNLRTAFYGLDDELTTYLYNPTHARAGPWLVGCIMGYILFQCKTRVIKLHKGVVPLLWFLSTGTMLVLVLYHNQLSSTKELSLWAVSSFNSLARISWAIAISIIIFLCVTGYGSVINSFLSSSVFTVLIRVNYSMYLLHMPVIVFDITQKMTPDYMTPRNLFYLFWGDFAITLILSILWTLAFESPVLVLEKLLLGRNKRPSSNGTALKAHNNNIDVVVINHKLNERDY